MTRASWSDAASTTPISLAAAPVKMKSTPLAYRSRRYFTSPHRIFEGFDEGRRRLDIGVDRARAIGEGVEIRPGEGQRHATGVPQLLGFGQMRRVDAADISAFKELILHQLDIVRLILAAGQADDDDESGIGVIRRHDPGSRSHLIECRDNDIDAGARQISQCHLKSGGIERLQELRLHAECFRRHIQPGDQAIDRPVVAGRLRGHQRHPHRIILPLNNSGAQYKHDQQ